MKFFHKIKISNRALSLQQTPQHQTKLALIKKITQEVLDDTLSKAIIKILVTPSWFVKVFWMFGLLGASSLCSYFLVGSAINFFTYELSTVVRVHSEIASLFPKVTICNKNAFTSKYAWDLANGTNYNEFLYRVNNELSEVEKQKLSHDFKDLLLECSFNSQPCAYYDFSWEYDRALGNCYSFNSGFNLSGHRVLLKKSIRAGSSYGLKLTLYVNFYGKITNKTII